MKGHAGLLSAHRSRPERNAGRLTRSTAREKKIRLDSRWDQLDIPPVLM